MEYFTIVLTAKFQEENGGRLYHYAEDVLMSLRDIQGLADNGKYTMPEFDGSLDSAADVIQTVFLIQIMSGNRHITFFGKNSEGRDKAIRLRKNFLTAEVLVSP